MGTPFFWFAVTTGALLVVISGLEWLRGRSFQPGQPRRSSRTHAARSVAYLL